MIDFETEQIRQITKSLAPKADFDGDFTFYYDETNNIRKFYVRENDFNSPFTGNFILGGLVCRGVAQNLQQIFEGLQLQKTTKDVKLKHIAKGEFLDCLRSTKLNFFLTHIHDSNFYLHYTSINILYWSIVDIIDSAIANSKVSMQLGPEFALKLKNDLYQLSRLELDAVIDLFYKFGYPNIKEGSVTSFIETLLTIFSGYFATTEFHFSLECLRQILRDSTKEGTLPFIMDEEDCILIKDFYQFYLQPVYLFKNSKHFFDKEDSILEVFSKYRILEGDKELRNYEFITSESSLLIQASDILVGLLGKLSIYLNTSAPDDLRSDFHSLGSIQYQNMELLLRLIDKSLEKNIAFLYAIDSYQESMKMEMIREIMGSSS